MGQSRDWLRHVLEVTRVGCPTWKPLFRFGITVGWPHLETPLSFRDHGWVAHLGTPLSFGITVGCPT